MPTQLKPDNIVRDLEFESMLRLASRLQTSHRPRPTETATIQRPEGFSTLTSSSALEENLRGRSIWNGKYRDNKVRKLVCLYP